MRTKYSTMKEDEIDALVIAQANDDAAWEPRNVVHSKMASVALPAALAVRAAFFARIHREKTLESWLKRIIQERLDIEEAAFSGFKKEMMDKRMGQGGDVVE